jgi:hypothetical protein
MGDVSISEDDLFRFVSLMNSEDPLLYFIQSGDDGPIKIGLSKNIRARLNQLQTSHHESLSVIGICRGGYFEERHLHKTFAAFHMKGEWFVPDIKILEYISEHSLIKVSRVEDQLSKLKNTVAQKMDDSVHILNRSIFNNLSPLAQATAIVLERRGMVRIVRDEEEEGSTPPGCSNDESKALLKAESASLRKLGGSITK